MRLALQTAWRLSKQRPVQEGFKSDVLLAKVEAQAMRRVAATTNTNLRRRRKPKSRSVSTSGLGVQKTVPFRAHGLESERFSGAYGCEASAGVVVID